MLELAELTVRLRAREQLRLPVYKGATVRGAFGNAFRSVTCPFPKRACPDCLLRSKCVYSVVFETPRPEGAQVMRKYETVPHPFVIEPPTDSGRDIEPGSALAFRLILLGASIGYLPYFVYAFEEMARRGLGAGRGELELLAVEQDGKVVYQGEKKALVSPVRAEELDLRPIRNGVSDIRLRLLTPLRIVYQGRIAQSLDFHVLFRSLIRRIGLLAYFYSEKPPELDYRGLIARAQCVKTRRSDLAAFNWRRFSSRQDRAIDMEGLTGSVEYHGDLTEFLPFLRIGERVHVGKGTAFGLGKFEVETRNVKRGAWNAERGMGNTRTGEEGD